MRLNSKVLILKSDLANFILNVSFSLYVRWLKVVKHLIYEKDPFVTFLVQYSMEVTVSFLIVV